jgi:hypothetical protein
LKRILESVPDLCNAFAVDKHGSAELSVDTGSIYLGLQGGPELV